MKDNKRIPTTKVVLVVNQGEWTCCWRSSRLSGPGSNHILEVWRKYNSEQTFFNGNL